MQTKLKSKKKEKTEKKMKKKKKKKKYNMKPLNWFAEYSGLIHWRYKPSLKL